MSLECSADSAVMSFYTDQLGYKTEFVVDMMRPFLDSPPPVALLDPRDPNSVRFDSFNASAHRLFNRVERPLAEIAVLPWDWEVVRNHPALLRQARRFIRQNAAAGLRTLVFSMSDPETALREPDMILFRTSLIGKKLRSNEHAMPGWALFVAGLHMQNLPLRKLEPRPVVGFCGDAKRSGFREPSWFRRTFRPWRCQYERVLPKKPGIRALILDQLRAAPGLRTNIVEREGFFGGARVKINGKMEWKMDLHLITRQEYVENILGSDYALCVRGAGNYSLRLCDVLQLGRIPLFINTDCVLPWPEYIPWRRLCVWVEQTELDHLEKILLAYHSRLDQPEFEERQRQCRAVWEKYLSPLGFFTTMRTWLREHGHCRPAPKN
jgi:hypothetical protein